MSSISGTKQRLLKIISADFYPQLPKSAADVMVLRTGRCGGDICFKFRGGSGDYENLFWPISSPNAEICGRYDGSEVWGWQWKSSFFVSGRKPRLIKSISGDFRPVSGNWMNT